MLNLTQHITLPDEGYPYFEKWSEHPFRADAPDFSWVNAWRLAEASLLAYGDKDFATEKLKAIPLTREFISKESAQYHLLYNDEFVIVAFRGTEFPKLNPEDFEAQLKSMWADVVADSQIWLEDFEGKGKVHHGFYQAFLKVSKELEHHLEKLAPRPVWFTGHSMGGALATLASVHFNNQRLYTFGSPVVGDAQFAQFAPRNHYRFVNNNDFVANLSLQNFAFPQRWHNYVHSGQEMRFDSNGNLITNATVEGFAARILGAIKQPFTALGNFIFKHEVTLPIDAFNDHVPRHYAEIIQKKL